MRATSARTALVLFALTALSLGCAAHTSSTTRSTTPAPTVYRAEGRGASRYQSQGPEQGALRGPHAYRVSQGLESAAKSGIRLQPDARLAELASIVAEHEDTHGTLPPGAAIDLWAHHLGLWEPTPAIALIKQPDPGTLADLLATDLKKAAQSMRYTHYGAVTIERDGGVIAVVALSFRWAQLEPIERSAQEGASLDVRGELDAGLDAPQLIVTYPDGTSARGEEQHGRRFSLSAPSRGRGAHRVELLARSSLGPTVVANFPVYVGVPPVTEVAVTPDDASEGGSVSEVRERLLRLLNDERRRAGLRELRWNDELARIAHAHSTDMHEHGFVGHTSPTTGSAEERVKAAGLRVPLVLENIGRGYGAEGVHRGLADSPGHRDNMLSRDATHVGIGVVAVEDGDPRAYLVTEVFTRMPERIDASDAARELQRAVAAERKRARVPEARIDAELSKMAAEAAQEFIANPKLSERDVLSKLTKRAANAGLPYRGLSGLLVVVAGIDQAATLDALRNPRTKGLGIGVAQGTRPDTIQDAIAVVVLLGE